jgi:hypothetical protein
MEKQNMIYHSFRILPKRRGDPPGRPYKGDDAPTGLFPQEERAERGGRDSVGLQSKITAVQENLKMASWI